jgi:hypothetical protein
MIRGGLFSRFFLEDGIRETDAYRALDPAQVLAFADGVRGCWSRLEPMARPLEAETEAEFIFPVLDRLGWHHLPQQTPGKGRQDVADALLFLTEADKDAARKLPSVDRFRLGAVVVENEARDTLLDRASGHGEAPSTQILRYLGRAEAQSGGVVRWGLLTNGRFWRLYWAQARARAEGFFEFDLPGLLGPMPPPPPAEAPPDHWLRVFLLLFRQQAFVPHGPVPRSFLDDALAEGRRYEARVTALLSEAVFNEVFPALVAAIGRHDPQARINDEAWRAEAREGALRLLFRLLFVLYAEDRDLLPVHRSGYADYSLNHLRSEASKLADNGRSFPARAATWWPRLRALFDAVSAGDTTMGLPPYNGGLFRDEPGSLLHRLTLPDAVLAPLVEKMSREGPPLDRHWINYRDLSVQHLGSIYEQLLEQDVVPDGGGGVSLRPNAFARRTTGSYYTPEELVQLIIRRAVGPLLRERREAFAAKAAELAGERRRRAERLDLLAPLDPAEAFLNLRVCDPAMGSGHFLVALVDYLAAQTLEAIADAPTKVAWGDYRSPLTARIEAIRARIKAQAATHGWPVRDDQLDDRHIVRRIILKRCVYGVDLNPMAVELAKLALWLHSFTVGAPLSFLDHHLRCGDSLFGEFVGPVERDLHARYGLSMSSAVEHARNAAKGMALVEEQTDADIAEVEASAAGFAGVEQDTAPLRAFLDLYHAARWLPDKEPVAAAGRGILFGGGYGDPVAIAGGAKLRTPRKDAADIPRNGNGHKAPLKAAEAHEAARGFVAAARALAAERRLLHWEVAFPGVWEAWEALTPVGGFHAVIGNPPWDRMKMQEVEWFAARVPAIATATKAADRKRAIEALRRRSDPVAAEYDRAAGIAETAARVVRDIGAHSPLPDVRGRPPAAFAPEDVAYPLLSGGDVNVYSLMVERASRLVRPDGIVGLLVPSGITADLGAAPFFRQISTGGRLAALLDFENRRTTLNLEPFFPDVDSRFKFSALVFGGRRRHFAAAACAFFKQSAEAAEREAFTLAPADFAAVNPNTGTAPVFRTPRDAEITKGIYARLPVLVDRREKPPRRVWPVRYATMFHMTNDSAKFRSEVELRKLGAYEVQGQRWEKGRARWLPLLVGRSINIFDHRAASVVEDSENLHNPFNSKLTTEGEHADPGFAPRSHFWVSEADIEWPEGLGWAISFRDIARPTDVRTVIAAAVPKVGFGNKLPLLLPDALASAANPGLAAPLAYRRWAPLLVANLNSMVLDFVARQKVHGTTLNLFILEQLPVVPAAGFARRFGTKTAEQIVREDVLALTYTAHDMAAFARDMGHTGPPFPWNPEDRLRRRARLDALFFHLYDLDRDAADTVMSTFPIVREQEEAAYAGRFRSRDLVLNTMAALAAGNPDANVAG